MTYNKLKKKSYRELVRENKIIKKENNDLRTELKYISAHLYVIYPNHKIFTDEMEEPFLDMVKDLAIALKIKNKETIQSERKEG